MNERTGFGDVPSTRAEAKARATVTPNTWIPSPAVRTWLYGIIAAVVPLLGVLGILTPDVAGHVLSIAGALLAVGGLTLAARNTPKD